MIDWTLSHADATSAIVWVRSDTAETITVTLPHGSFSTVVDPLVEHGTGSITITGLTGDTVGTINGEAITVKVSPATPVIAIPSCHSATEATWARYVMEQGVNIVVVAGDFPYCDTAVVNYGGITTVATGTSLANNATEEYCKHYLQHRRIPALRDMYHSALLYGTYDDHEVLNNFDWTVARANAQGALAVDAAGVRAIYDRAMAAWTWYNARGLQKPGGLETDPAPQYSTCRHGPIEIFILDSISNRSPVTATDNASKYMLGPLQEARLVSDVTTSEASYKIIVSGKQPYTNALANDDSYVPMTTNTGYTTQRDRIMADLAGTAGVVWVAGDDHSTTVVDHPSGCFLLSGCPVSSGNQVTGQGAGYETGVVFKGFGYSGTPPATLDSAATNIVRLLPTGELSLEVHDLGRRSLWWRKRMRPDGTMYYPPNLVG